MSILNKLNIKNPFKKNSNNKEIQEFSDMDRMPMQVPKMRLKKRGMTNSFSAHRLSSCGNNTEHQKFKRLSFNADCLINPNNSSLHHVSANKDCSTLIPYKLLLIGDTGVGKSSLLSRFCDKIFMTTYIDTVGVDCKIKQITFKNELNMDLVPTINSISKRHSELLVKSNYRNTFLSNETINAKLQIWDTSGASKYFSIIKNYYRGVHGILLVYDVKNQKSFDNVRMWMKSITDYANNDVEIYLIANKCDFTDTSKRKISKYDGEQLAKSYGIKYIETSAKSNLNIDNTFIDITKCIKNKLDKKQFEALVTLTSKTKQLENVRKSSMTRRYLNTFKFPPNNSIKSFNQNLNRKLLRIFLCFPVKS